MDIKKGLRFRVSEDSVDEDENGNQIVTPAGSILVVGDQIDSGEWVVTCPESGGQWHISGEEIADEIEGYWRPVV